jgi:bifunctional DNase/RNase
MVELVVSDMMSRVSDRRAHVLMLREKEGLRKIIVALGMLEAQAIAFSLRDVDAGRPLSHDLVGALAVALGAEMDHVLINSIEDGTFHSMIFCRRGEETVSIDSRTSDAVAIALRCGLPIFIREELLNRMCVHDEHNGAISIPITAADEETLRVAMDNAVKAENYELAMKLKEEIESRHTPGRVESGNEQNTTNIQ